MVTLNIQYDAKGRVFEATGLDDKDNIHEIHDLICYLTARSAELQGDTTGFSTMRQLMVLREVTSTLTVTNKAISTISQDEEFLQKLKDRGSKNE